MEFRESQSIYLQIADLVCEKIITGKWPQGEKILSVRDLAVELQVNPNTVMRTYDFLNNLEIIYNKRGLGFFVPDDGIKKTVRYRKEQFMKNDLPALFKNMSILNIDLNEIQQQYDRYVKIAKKK